MARGDPGATGRDVGAGGTVALASVPGSLPRELNGGCCEDKSERDSDASPVANGSNIAPRKAPSIEPEAVGKMSALVVARCLYARPYGASGQHGWHGDHCASGSPPARPRASIVRSSSEVRRELVQRLALLSNSLKSINFARQVEQFSSREAAQQTPFRADGPISQIETVTLPVAAEPGSAARSATAGVVKQVNLSPPATHEM